DNAAVSYPKEVIDATGAGQLKEYVGTGPFRFVEHRPDRHVKLARFDGYVPRSEPASGLAGQRIAYLDELYFIAVPDYAIRQAGIVTGDYTYIELVKPDHYERLKSTPGVEPVVIKPYGWVTIVLNTKQGLMADKRLRQAVQAALDVEPMMLAAMGHKEFYRLDPGILFQEQTLHSKKRAAIWDKVQAIFYADAARIRLGDYFRLDARRREVQGFQNGPYMHFWNVWLDRK